MPKVFVRLSSNSYPIQIGADEPVSLGRMVRKHVKSGRAFVFYDAQVHALHRERLRRSLGIRSGLSIEMVIAPGEKSKSAATLGRIHDYLLQEKISRDDLIIACGGGVITDLVGYAAATILRGVRWGVVPTTLLGMVDASIGGKTAINHRRGKNLIGAFWQPIFVHCDIGLLQTLSIRQMIAGLGEVVKYGGLIGSEMTGLLAGYLERGNLYHQRDLIALVKLSAEYKADIVGRDEREGGVRMYLNYGHTVGHAIEKAIGYGKLLHGEAVILGILAALELGEFCGVHRTRAFAEYREIVAHLMTMVPFRRINPAEVLEAMALDKKRRGADLRYVLLSHPGKPFVAEAIERRLIKKALQRMLAFYESHGGTNAHHPGS